MATKTVEVQRKALSAEDAKKLQEMMATLDGHRTQYGQYQFNLDYLRAQYEQAVQQSAEEGDTLRSSIQESQAAVQEYSQGLLESYEVDTSGGGWSLDTAEGAFIQYREEEVKKPRRKKASKPRKTGKPNKAKAKPRKTRAASSSRRAAAKRTKTK